MRFEKLLVSVAGFAAAALVSVPAVGGERTVVGEYFSATW